MSSAAANLPPRSGTGSRPVTLRAMLAAECCPELSTGVKHLVHVLALRADNVTGRGLTGQATVGLYMGLSRRQVTRLWAELDAAWKAGTSPVGTLRSKRYQNSDVYTIVVRENAALRLDRPQSRSYICDKVRVTSTSHQPKVNVTSATGGSDTSVTSTPSESDMGVLLTSQLPLQREAAEIRKELPRPDASGAPPHALGERGGAPTTEADRAWAAGAVVMSAEGPRGGVDSSEPPSVFAIAAARRRARKLEREQRGIGNHS